MPVSFASFKAISSLAIKSARLCPYLLSAINDYYHNGIQIHQSDISWAIGGTSLFMDRTYSNASEYYADICDEDPPATSSITRRTAIAYLGGVTLYELRQILKDIWNVPYHAIALDGGGSTQIQYRENGVLNYQVVNDSSASGQKSKRKIWSMLIFSFFLGIWSFCYIDVLKHLFYSII